MGLRINRVGTFKGKLTVTLMAIFALVAQPLYVAVETQIAKAVNSSIATVVVNEISSKTPEKIELYGPSLYDVSGWTVQFHNTEDTLQSVTLPVDTTLNAHGFLTVETQGRWLADSGDTVRLFNASKNLIDSVTYGTAEVPLPTTTKNVGRSTDGSTTWALVTPSLEASNVAPTVAGDTSAAVAEASIATEEFVTNSDDRFKGISVGFTAKDFKDVTNVTVTMKRADGGDVVKTAAAGVLALLNDDGKEQLTTPFVVEAGTYGEAIDTGYWNLAENNAWTKTSIPESVVIEITHDNGKVVSTIHAGPLTEANGITYASLLPATQRTEVVIGNTASTENVPGWMFNRDQNTKTPFKFTKDAASIGEGSIYVEPIGGVNPKDKFIAEYFQQIPVKDLKSVSYDFKIAGSGTAADADDFYLNVYANIDSSNNYYDCRYDYVPLTGSTSGFTTVKFNAADTPTRVATRVDRIGTCPTTLAGMPAGSHVRVIAFNVGQSTASDVGLAGYLDNVVVATNSEVTTYDMEYVPDPTNSHQLTVSGSLYRDLALNDCNGKAQCESRTDDIFAGWTVNLYKLGPANGWSKVQTTTSNEKGVYKFGAQRDAGTYYICAEPGAGWTQSKQLWNGSGYRVATDNLSGNDKEGDYCAETVYTDAKNHSFSSKLGFADVTAPVVDGASISISPMTAEKVVRGKVRVEFTMTDANEINLSKSLTHVRLTNGHKADGESVSSSAYQVFHLQGDRYYADITTEDFVAGTVATEFRLYFRTEDKVGKGNQAGVAYFKKQITVDNEAPAAPTGLHRVTKDGKVTYACDAVVKPQVLIPTWKSNAETDLAYYEYTSFNANGRIGLNAERVDTNKFDHNWMPPQGTSGYTVRAVDAAGNKSAWAPGGTMTKNDSCQVTYDSTAPVIALSLDHAGDVLTIGGSVTDNAKLSHYNLSLYKDGVNVENAGNRIAGGSAKWDAGVYGSFWGTKYESKEVTISHTLDTSKLEPGTYQVRLNARDAVGGTANSGNLSTPLVVKFTVKEKPIIVPTVVGENFNTHKGLDYEGIAVGFRIKDAQSATALRVEMTRADGSKVEKVAGDAVLKMIKTGDDVQLSTPFVIKEHIFKEENDKNDDDEYYWIPTADQVWDVATVPESVAVYVTYADAEGEVPYALESTFSQNTTAHVSYAEITPKTIVFTPAPVDQGQGGPSRNPSRSGSTNTVADSPALTLAPIFVGTASAFTNPDSFFGRAAFFPGQLANNANESDDASDEVLGVTDVPRNFNAGGLDKSATVADDAAAEGFLLAWYWWLAIVAALVAFAWGVIAALRRDNTRKAYFLK